MKSIVKLVLLAAVYVIAFPPWPAEGQGVLDKTSFGQSQNGPRDLANSLTAAPKSYGKGEKKDQVNAAELKSKTTKDTTFGGSLLDMGIVGAEPKLDEQKLRSAHSESDSKASRESHTDKVKDSKQSEMATNDKESRVFTPTVGDAQTKQQRSTSGGTDEKPSSSSTEKSSTTKPDGGNH